MAGLCITSAMGYTPSVVRMRVLHLGNVVIECFIQDIERLGSTPCTNDTIDSRVKL